MTRVCSIISFQAILRKMKAICLGKKSQIPKGMEGFLPRYIVEILCKIG